MKFPAILLLCSVIYYGDAQYYTDDRLKAVFAKCSTEEEATADDIEDILSQKKAGSENAKCLRACMLQTCKVMDAFGNIDPNIHKEYLQLLSRGDVEKQNLIDSVVKNCLKTTKVEGKVCTTAEDYMDCVFTDYKNCGWDFHVL